MTKYRSIHRIVVLSTLMSCLIYSSTARAAPTGKLVGWGGDPYGYGLNNVPAGDDFTAIAAGGYHSLALKVRRFAGRLGLQRRRADDRAGGQRLRCHRRGRLSQPGAEGRRFARRLGRQLLRADDRAGGQRLHGHRRGQRSQPGAQGRRFARRLGLATPTGRRTCRRATTSRPSPRATFTAWRSRPTVRSPAGATTSIGQTNVPAGNGFTAIAAGFYHSLALKSDGSLVGWGNNAHGADGRAGGRRLHGHRRGLCHSLASSPTVRSSAGATTSSGRRPCRRATASRPSPRGSITAWRSAQCRSRRASHCWLLACRYSFGGTRGADALEEKSGR